MIKKFVLVGGVLMLSVFAGGCVTQNSVAPNNTSVPTVTINEEVLVHDQEPTVPPVVEEKSDDTDLSNF